MIYILFWGAAIYLNWVQTLQHISNLIINADPPMLKKCMKLSQRYYYLFPNNPFNHEQVVITSSPFKRYSDRLCSLPH